MAEINAEQKALLKLYLASEDKRIGEKQQEADRLQRAAQVSAGELEDMVRHRNAVAAGLF
ncbi:hypothetical protein [Mycobacterium avium]|uniref:hypothetical protein n=1 Tax=Mycobacterium avium TaxID=1764 RepID=UPI000CE56898|nr:hypothetical protein [Mycobacterium avium]